MGVLKSVGQHGGVLLKYIRLLLLILTTALVSTAAWADGATDPHVIGQGDPLGVITPITGSNPNPTVTGTAQSTNCPLESAYCVVDNFQNETGKTILSITMFFSSSANAAGLNFTCPSVEDMGSAKFFDVCTMASVAGGEDITLSANGLNGYDGVASAICYPDADDNGACDQDDWQGGLFAIDMYGSDVTEGLEITTQAITAAPEPGVGLMVLFGALAFGLLTFVRRTV